MCLFCLFYFWFVVRQSVLQCKTERSFVMQSREDQIRSWDCVNEACGLPNENDCSYCIFCRAPRPGYILVKDPDDGEDFIDSFSHAESRKCSRCGESCADSFCASCGFRRESRNLSVFVFVHKQSALDWMRPVAFLILSILFFYGVLALLISRFWVLVSSF